MVVLGPDRRLRLGVTGVAHFRLAGENRNPVHLLLVAGRPQQQVQITQLCLHQAVLGMQRNPFTQAQKRRHLCLDLGACLGTFHPAGAHFQGAIIVLHIDLGDQASGQVAGIDGGRNRSAQNRIGVDFPTHGIKHRVDLSLRPAHIGDFLAPLPFLGKFTRVTLGTAPNLFSIEHRCSGNDKAVPRAFFRAQPDFHLCHRLTCGEQPFGKRAAFRVKQVGNRQSDQFFGAIVHYAAIAGKGDPLIGIHSPAKVGRMHGHFAVKLAAADQRVDQIAGRCAVAAQRHHCRLALKGNRQTGEFNRGSVAQFARPGIQGKPDMLDAAVVGGGQKCQCQLAGQRARRFRGRQPQIPPGLIGSQNAPVGASHTGRPGLRGDDTLGIYLRLPLGWIFHLPLAHCPIPPTSR